MNSHLDSFYHEYARQGIRVAYALLRNRSDAEEAVQETFCRMHKANLTEKDDSFRGKFFVTLRNHCIDRIRRSRVSVDYHAFSELPARKGQQEPEYLELVEEIEAAIEQLPAEWSRALLLKTHGRFSYEEIAELTDSTIAQVRTWIFRARRQLEDKLTEAGFIKSPVE